MGTTYLIIVHFVDALGAIFAWVRQTLVNIILAVDATEAGARAIAQESAQFIFALATVLARLRFAIVDVDFAIASRHPVDANARIVGDAVNACRTGRARVA